SLSSVPAGGAPGEILDGGVCSGDGKVGHGSARRAGRAGRVRRGTLASGSDDSCDLGGNVTPPDSGWTGSDGTETGTPVAFPATRGNCTLERTSGHGIGSRAALETSARRKGSARRTTLPKACSSHGRYARAYSEIGR